MRASRLVRHLSSGCLFAACLAVIPPGHAAGPDDAGLRLLPLQAALTKESRTFDVKNLFPFRLPPDVTAANFRGLVGTLIIIARQTPDSPVPASSETLFGLAYTTNGACPTQAEAVDGYPRMFSMFPSTGLATAIVKQAAPGAMTLSLDFTLPVGIPIKLAPGGCLFMGFDGSDFKGQPYTMTSNLQMRYDTAPAPVPAPVALSLDGEFIVGPNNREHPTLNAYSVLTVSQSGPVRPGHVLAVYGNVAAVSSPDAQGKPQQGGRWNVRHIVAVYTKDSCAKAFPNHVAGKFFWNDRSGTARDPDTSSVFWPTSIHLADVTLSGEGLAAAQAPVSATPSAPVAVAQGDCLVEAVLPSGDATTTDGGVNTEIQTLLEYVPGG
jgi:hypothetical protein